MPSLPRKAEIITARGWGHGFGHRRFHPYKVVRTLSSGRRRSLPPRELQGEPAGPSISGRASSVKGLNWLQRGAGQRYGIALPPLRC